MENHHLEWIYPLKIVIFHSYVKLPEGTTRHLLFTTSEVEIREKLRRAGRRDLQEKPHGAHQGDAAGDGPVTLSANIQRGWLGNARDLVAFRCFNAKVTHK